MKFIVAILMKISFQEQEKALVHKYSPLRIVSNQYVGKSKNIFLNPIIHLQILPIMQGQRVIGK